MAIFDVDKGNADRGTPLPNTHDKLPPDVLMAKNTISTSYKTPSQNGNERIVFKNNLLISFDDQNRVSSIYGYVPQVANYPIIVIAPYGYDVFKDVLVIPRPF